MRDQWEKLRDLFEIKEILLLVTIERQTIKVNHRSVMPNGSVFRPAFKAKIIFLHKSRSSFLFSDGGCNNDHAHVLIIFFIHWRLFDVMCGNNIKLKCSPIITKSINVRFKFSTFFKELVIKLKSIFSSLNTKHVFNIRFLTYIKNLKTSLGYVFYSETSIDRFWN